MRRYVWLALLLLFSTSALGCAAMRAAVARQETLSREIAAHVIDKPLEQTWKLALAEHLDLWEKIGGVGFRWEETGRFQARSVKRSSTNKQQDGSIELENVWYEAEGASAGDGSQIRFFKVQERVTVRNGVTSLANRDRSRDLDMELAFIKKVDPKAGAAIEAKVRHAEEEARNE